MADQRFRVLAVATHPVQYLAPIVKNRQYNFPPIGVNPLVNAQARPNEVTYSEDWMRPDNRPSPPADAAPSLPAAATDRPATGQAPPADAPYPKQRRCVPAATMEGRTVRWKPVVVPPMGNADES